jgi:hypothetical protein
MGGEAETYYGLTDSFLMNSANDLIEMLFTNPELIDQHSSYQ